MQCPAIDDISSEMFEFIKEIVDGFIKDILLNQIKCIFYTYG